MLTNAKKCWFSNVQVVYGKREGVMVTYFRKFWIKGLVHTVNDIIHGIPSMHVKLMV